MPTMFKFHVICFTEKLIIWLFFFTFSYVIWNDSFISMERISELKAYQKINHFPGMAEVTRKDNLARNFMKYEYKN